jgi:pimeloyl-ACP methyl ester carboxylesterase
VDKDTNEVKTLEDKMRERFGNLSLYFDQVGSGRPIIMLHGWPLDHLSMKGAMEPIFVNREGWKRIYMDLPGMGQSDAPDWLKTQDQVLDVVVEFINQVISNQRFCVAGLSYGGLLAQGLVHHLAHQIDGVMFLVPSMATKKELPSHIVMYEESLNLDGLEEDQIIGFKGMAVVQTQAHLDAWKEHIFPGTARANYAFLDGLQRAYSFDMERLPQPFPAPTLFLLGRQDSAVGYRDAWRIIENYPHASFVVLDRAGHCLQMEQPRLYEALVHEWLDRVEEYAAKSADGKKREAG